MPLEAEDKAKEFWESDQGRWKGQAWEHWLQHPKVQERVQFLATGAAHTDRFQRFLQRYFGGNRGIRRVRRVLTLGCGTGEFERGLAQYGFAELHEAVDISVTAVTEATQLAAAAGHTHIQYRAADLNVIELEPCSYDVIFGISSVHHVADLRHLFHQVAVGLKPGGYFLLDEFIGPSQFQWTDNQLAAINEQIDILPQDLKTFVANGILKGPVMRASIEEMNAVDPSEAVRSAEIVGLLPEYFDVLEFNGYGGTVLHMLLEGITGNFREDDPRAMTYLRSIFEFEDRLIASGRLQHDFASIVVRRKPTRVQQMLGRHVALAVSRTLATLRRRHRR